MNIVKSIFRVYSIKLFLILLIIFILLLFSPFAFIPDLFNLNQINTSDILMRFIISSISFLGMVISFYILAFNIFPKTNKRNVVDILINNKWIKLLLTCFIFFVISSFFTYLLTEIIKKNNYITLCYFLFGLFFFIIIFTFPILLLSLKESISLKNISKIAKSIKDNDIKDLFYDSKTIEDSDSNKISLLKDIGLSSLKNGDSNVVLEILTILMHKFIYVINRDVNINKIKDNIEVVLFFVQDFKNECIKNKDILNLEYNISILFSIHKHLVHQKIWLPYFNNLDSILIDSYKSIIKNDISGIQEKIWVNLCKIIIDYINIFSAEDNRLYLRGRLDLIDKNTDKPENIIMKDHWFYLNSVLLKNYFELGYYAIDNNSNAIGAFSGNVFSLIDSVRKSSNLTINQKGTFIEEILYDNTSIIEYAIEKNFYNIHLLLFRESRIFIQYYNKMDIPYLTYTNFINSIYRILKKMTYKKRLDVLLLDDFFYIIINIIDSENNKFENNYINDNSIETLKLLLSTNWDTENSQQFKIQINTFKEVLLRNKNKSLLKEQIIELL